MDELVKALLSVPGTKKISVGLLLAVLGVAIAYFYYIENERHQEKTQLSKLTNSLEAAIEEFKTDMFEIKLVNAKLVILMDVIKEKEQTIEERLSTLESRVNAK